MKTVPLLSNKWNRFVRDNYDSVLNHPNRDRFRVLGGMYRAEAMFRDRPGCMATTAKGTSVKRLPCTCLSARAMLRIVAAVNKVNRIDDGRRGRKNDRTAVFLPNASALSKKDPCKLFRYLKTHFGTAHPRDWVTGISSNYFRPKKDPIAKRMLSTNDINNILEQYAGVIPEFISYGAVPADYCGLEYTSEVCKVSLKRMLAVQKRCAAFVINTDPSNRGGEHWIALWIDIRNEKPPTILFWDSLGNPPPPQVQATMDRLYNEARALYKSGVLERSPQKLIPVIPSIPHQKGGVDCGTYCIYIIIYLLTGGAPKLLQSDKNSMINNRLMREYFYHIYPENALQNDVSQRALE